MLNASKMAEGTWFEHAWPIKDRRISNAVSYQLLNPSKIGGYGET